MSTTVNENKPFISTGQAAQLLCVSTSTVIRWSDEGRLEFRRMGQRRQISRASVDALLVANTPGGESEGK